MANTTNFGWETPDDTDLVKDGALAMRTLGNAIDTSLVDLKGGTTGQVLSKTSNTDMDFTWVTSDDANAIQNAIVDAKGDLITATAADTPARLAVGSNGDNLTADSGTSTGLRWQGNYAAGKNKIINGDFRLNQRSFTSTTTSATFGFDRFSLSASDGTNTYSAETFTPGTAPVAGYEAINFARLVSTGQTATTALTSLQQAIEDVRTFAGQTITVSFWAKASTGTPNVVIWLGQDFGSGGSTQVNTGSTKQAISASWARYSFVISVPSVSGKTIGTGSALRTRIVTSAGTDRSAYTDSIGIQSVTIDIWGVQVENGSVATAFQTATGTLQGELAACQRYYVRFNANEAAGRLGATTGSFTSATNAYVVCQFPVTLRTKASSIDYGGTIGLYDFNSDITVTTLALTATCQSPFTSLLTATVASGGTQYRPIQLEAKGDSAAYLGFSAEL